MRMIPMGLAAFSILATMASAKPHLREVAEIDNGLLAVGIADEIRKNCPAISPRIFRAVSYVESLKSKARALGYSDAEIRAYYKSEVEKARVRAKGEAYLVAK